MRNICTITSHDARTIYFHCLDYVISVKFVCAHNVLNNVTTRERRMTKATTATTTTNRVLTINDLSFVRCALSLCRSGSHFLVRYQFEFDSICMYRI